MSNFEKRESETFVRTDPKIISFTLTKQSFLRSDTLQKKTLPVTRESPKNTIRL